MDGTKLWNIILLTVLMTWPYEGVYAQSKSGVQYSDNGNREKHADHVNEVRIKIGTTRVTCWVEDEGWSRRANCSFAVNVIGRCPEDQTEHEELGTLTWPITETGCIADSNQRCPIDTENGGYGLATRVCYLDEDKGIANWGKIDVQNCGEQSEVDLEHLTQVPVVEYNVREVTNALEDISDTIKVLAQDDIDNIAETLDNIAKVEEPCNEVTSSMVRTVGSILENADSDSEKYSPASSSSIVLSLEHQIQVAVQSLGNLSIIDPTIGVVALTLNSSDVIIGGVTFVVDDVQDKGGLDDNRVHTFTDVNDVPADIETTLQLPESLFLTDKQGTQQMSFTVYRETFLFTSLEKTAQNLTVAGSIVSAEVIGKSNTSFTDPFVIKFLPYQIPDITEKVTNTSICVFWDFALQNGTGDWSEEGCVFAGIENERVVCECNHLTNFAVLMNIGGHNLNGVQTLVLQTITYVGCGLSMIALIATLIIFLRFRKLHMQRHQIILIHFCSSLLLLYVVFISGIDTALNSHVGCVAVAVLIHYFTLTTMMWMGVTARNLFRTLVSAFSVPEPGSNRFMIFACLIAWGCPVGVVGLTVGVGFDNYVSKNYCFLPPGPSLYYGLLLPLGLILLHNCFSFVFIMYTILKTRMKSSGMKNGKTNDVVKNLQNAITISFLLGLTWIFGFLAIGGATFTFQLMFCLCNSTQGLAIFLLFCCRAEDVRNTMKPYFRRRTATYDISESVKKEYSSSDPMATSRRIHTSSTSDTLADSLE